MAIVTTTNATGGTVSLRVDDPERIAYLRGLVEKGDLLSVEVDDADEDDLDVVQPESDEDDELADEDDLEG